MANHIHHSTTSSTTGPEVAVTPGSWKRGRSREDATAVWGEHSLVCLVSSALFIFRVFEWSVLSAKCLSAESLAGRIILELPNWPMVVPTTTLWHCVRSCCWNGAAVQRLMVVPRQSWRAQVALQAVYLAAHFFQCVTTAWTRWPAMDDHISLNICTNSGCNLSKWLLYVCIVLLCYCLYFICIVLLGFLPLHCAVLRSVVLCLDAMCVGSPYKHVATIQGAHPTNNKTTANNSV